MADDTLSPGLIEGLGEVLAWKRGEIALEVVDLDPMSPERIKAIRKKAARPSAEFETRYGIPAATVSNGSGRKPDQTARLPLKGDRGRSGLHRADRETA